MNLKDIAKVKFVIASPESIKEWSYGEVTKPETINYKSHRTEEGGLFCQKIFGPTKDYECACGRYKKQKHRGKVCEKCGVEVIESRVRRTRMGHIDLAVPIAHIWYVKVRPIISRLLTIKQKSLQEVIYFASHVVVNPGSSSKLKRGQTLSSESADTKSIFHDILVDNEDKFTSDFEKMKYRNAMEALSSNEPFNFDIVSKEVSKVTGAKFGIGAEAIFDMLENLDVDAEIKITRETLAGIDSDKTKSAATKFKQISKKLETLLDFKKSGAKPEWTILKTIPVIPPDLRPLIALDGGRFTSADVNELYRKVIIRNERVKKLLKQSYIVEIILRNEIRMLQDAVDTLLDNARRKKPSTAGVGKKRLVKSLADSLTGKQGRFRQNLLGKRVDYSGRSVIAVGPGLKMNECGLPVEMILKLFQPFIAHELVKSGVAANAKVAENLIANQDSMIWDSVDRVISDRPVLLNRAPSLHRLSVQAFYPKIVNGKAIRLHPLVTPAFNADFDGDQMAVHVPITDAAVWEAKNLLIGSKNILGLKDGKPIATPSQDMVLGNYYLTKVKKGAKGEGNLFSNFNEVERAFELGSVELGAIIALPFRAIAQKFPEEVQKANESSYFITTVGKAILNKNLPNIFRYINDHIITDDVRKDKPYIVKQGQDIRKLISGIKEEENWISFFKPLTKANISDLIYEVFTTVDEDPSKPIATSTMLDNLKDLGFKYATKAGVTISVSDIEVDDFKYELFKDAEANVKKANEYFEDGLLTREEKHNVVVKQWGKTKDIIQNHLKAHLEKDKENPIYMMSDSGARGNISNFTQLSGMRGLMAKAMNNVALSNRSQSNVIEMPVKSSFREGLKISEFFISTYGARKGLTDTALNTGRSGYYTRRIVDVAQDIIVKEDDCGTKKGHTISDIVNTKDNSIIIPLKDRIIGRNAFKDIKDDKGNVLVKKDNIITAKAAKAIIDAGIKDVEIRSIFTCNTVNGVCQKCFGVDLSTNKEVDLNVAVGIVAAQSIGEPGTQLTMRTFHTGGVATGGDIARGLVAVIDIIDAIRVSPRVWAEISEVEGKVTDIIQGADSDVTGAKRSSQTIEIESNDGEVKKYKVDANAVLRVAVGDEVKPGAKLTDGLIRLHELLRVTDKIEVGKYMMKELHRIYKTAAGIYVSDKYFEILIKQLLRFEIVHNAGDTTLPTGVPILKQRVDEANAIAKEKGLKLAQSNPEIIGSRYAPLYGQSFLAAASFTETVRMIIDASISEKVDYLNGIKENVILGRQIPAGSGKIDMVDILGQSEDTSPADIDLDASLADIEDIDANIQLGGE